MSIPSYNKGYPPDGSSLGQTKATIRDNLDGTFDTLGVDHVNNNGVPGPPNTPPGYHTVIHQVTQGTAPVAISGVNQLYSFIPTIPDNINPQLFNKNGLAGANAQMTGNIKADFGLVWCAGILLQWGFANITDTSPVTFSPAFPNNCFTVLTTPYWVGGPIPNGVAVASVKNVSESGFSWVFNTNSGAYAGGGFYWFAIGF
jgi:hypothetical protein